MHTLNLTARCTLLLTAFRLTHQADPLACRTADRLLDHLGQQPVTYALDGDLLQVASFGHEPGGIYRCTATGCSCKGGRAPWCQHRVLRAVLLADQALAANDDDLPERIPCFAPPPPLAPLPHAMVDDPPARHAQAFADITALFEQ